MLSDEMRVMTDVPVLVVGAGPAGLATAIELARRDVECLLIDRRRRRVRPHRKRRPLVACSSPATRRTA